MLAYHMAPPTDFLDSYWILLRAVLSWATVFRWAVATTSKLREVMRGAQPPELLLFRDLDRVQLRSLGRGRPMRYHFQVQLCRQDWHNQFSGQG